MTLRHSDLPWLSGAIIAGGVVGPVLLLVGLTRTDAATASLLRTLEGVATVLMAWFLFHENFDRRVVLGMACLLAGVAVLSWSGQPTLSDPLLCKDVASCAGDLSRGEDQDRSAAHAARR